MLWIITPAVLFVITYSFLSNVVFLEFEQSSEHEYIVQLITQTYSMVQLITPFSNFGTEPA